MKKISFFIICFSVIFAFSASSVSAWDYCFKDTNYLPELQMRPEFGNTIHGQAILPTSPSFPAAITGKFIGGHLFFSIDYFGDTGLRFYQIQVPSLTGETWGVYSDSGEFYDPPHGAQLIPCSASSSDDSTNGTGAAE